MPLIFSSLLHHLVYGDIYLLHFSCIVELASKPECASQAYFRPCDCRKLHGQYYQYQAALAINQRWVECLDILHNESQEFPTLE